MIAQRLAKLSLPPGGQDTAVSSNQIAIASRVRQNISTVNPNNWFGPNQPMTPQAPSDTLPRTFDYPYGSNLWTIPRQDNISGPSFKQLRAIADNYDILRLIIETRKEQVCRMPWAFRLKDDGENSATSRDASIKNPDVKFLTQFMKRPDRENTFQQWMKMLLEEVLVIDALSIWPAKNKGTGKVEALRIIDGATIKPLHNENGWRPSPPDPAYQQIIKGMPEINMTSDTLAYCPRNPRVHKYYGFPPTEQIMMTVAIAMNRQMSTLSYYTEGNVPEMIIQAPKEWTKDDIKAFQAFFDEIAGNVEVKRRVRWIPETKGITQTKDKILNDVMDEWLARVCCYAYSVPPTPFVRMVNRASGVTMQESALEEGLEPLLIWLEETITYIVNHHMGFPDVEFKYNTEKETDRMKKAKIAQIEVFSGQKSLDEIRLADGQSPLGIGNFVMVPGVGPVMVADIISGKFDPTKQVKPDPLADPKGKPTKKVKNSKDRRQIA